MRNDGRRLLPILNSPITGGRQAVTCHYRCNNACARPVPNTSDNQTFAEVVAEGASRRQVLITGGLGLATAAAFAAADTRTPAVAADIAEASEGPLGFKGIAPTPAEVDEFKVPEGFAWNPLCNWGDPLTPDAPAFDIKNQSEAAQKQQAGYNADFVSVIPTGDNTAVLSFNNEYTNPELMFDGLADARPNAEQQAILLAAHGLTITALKRASAEDFYERDLNSPVNRRIHLDTEFAFTGPAAGSDLLKTKATPKGKNAFGTMNNCAGGVTPWGTILSGEENWNGYFLGDADNAAAQEEYERYGVVTSADELSNYFLDAAPRFDLRNENNALHHFGYIIEIDPMDPTATPRKHTALGRFKHEGANVTIAANGHAVAYMGDDERFDYMYKFVSRKKYVEGNKQHNMKLLEDGDLYVAKFSGDGFEDGVSDGSGIWIPLTQNGKSMVPGMSVEEVLVLTRLAADKVGPTKMDRPEDVQPNPVNGRIYGALTNNSKRAPGEIDEANPRAENKHGQVIEITEAGGDHTGTKFTWKLVLIAGDPTDPTTYFNGYDKSMVAPISCPDNVAFDKAGNLWISTDGMPGTLGHCDGLYAMPVAGENMGLLTQFLSVPTGAECSGPLVSTDNTSVFVAVQHPGEIDGASTTNVFSQFPYKGDGFPRPGVVEVKRTKDAPDPIVDTGVASGSAFGSAQSRVGSLFG